MSKYEKVLVTGGTGLIGSHLKELRPNWIYNSSFATDLTDISATRYMFDLYKPDAVIHLAARVGGIEDNVSRPIEYLEQNVLINNHVVMVARETGVKKFVATLSTCCYPDVVDDSLYPMDEELLYVGMPNRMNFGYAQSKRLLGMHIDVCRDNGYDDYSYVIPSNLYGEHEYFKPSSTLHYVGALIRKIIEANKNGSDHITLLGDGTPLRQFTYAGDVAKILADVIDDNISECMNIATPEIMTIERIARTALEATGNTHLEIRWNKPELTGQHRKDASISRFKKAFPNFEFTSYIEGIKRTYNNWIDRSN